MSPLAPAAVPSTREGPRLPPARGPWSAAFLKAAAGRGGALESLPDASSDALADHDLQLALYCCYELHYRGFAGVAAEREWDPQLLALRARLEAMFLAAVRAQVDRLGSLPSDPVDALVVLSQADGGPSLSRYAETHATLEQVEEICAHRSAYQRKEADPHSWAIPRLGGEAKAALIEIQTDEYGNGVTGQMHAELFAVTLEGLGMDCTYGAYLDRLPGVTLATTNLMSLFGLHRRWLGALVGHLALFEMTSRRPMRRYANAFTRVGAPPSARRFFDVHVEVDAHHEQVALRGLVAAFVCQAPEQAADVTFGAAALTAVERRFSEWLLGAWRDGRSSLLPLAKCPESERQVAAAADLS